jgi:hypothetical protein
VAKIASTGCRACLAGPPEPPGQWQAGLENQHPSPGWSAARANSLLRSPPDRALHEQMTAFPADSVGHGMRGLLPRPGRLLTLVAALAAAALHGAWARWRL